MGKLSYVFEKNGIYDVHLQDGSVRHFYMQKSDTGSSRVKGIGADVVAEIRRHFEENPSTKSVTNVERVERFVHGVAPGSKFAQFMSQDTNTSFNNIITLDDRTEFSFDTFEIEHLTAQGSPMGYLTSVIEDALDEVPGLEVQGFIDGLGKEGLEALVQVEFMASMIAGATEATLEITVDEALEILSDPEHAWWSSDDAHLFNTTLSGFVEAPATFIHDFIGNVQAIFNGGYVLVVPTDTVQFEGLLGGEHEYIASDPYLVNIGSHQGQEAIDNARALGYDLYASTELQEKWSNVEFKGTHDDFSGDQDGHPHHFRYGKAWGSLIGEGLSGVFFLAEGGKGVASALESAPAKVEQMIQGLADIKSVEPSPFFKNAIESAASNIANKRLNGTAILRSLKDQPWRGEALEKFFNNGGINGRIDAAISIVDDGLVVSVRPAQSNRLPPANVIRAKIAEILGTENFDLDTVGRNEPLPRNAKVTFTRFGTVGLDRLPGGNFRNSESEKIYGEFVAFRENHNVRIASYDTTTGRFSGDLSVLEYLADPRKEVIWVLTDEENPRLLIGYAEPTM